MINSAYRTIISDGLWHNNQAIVALLGLCPLLAVSVNVVNATALGLATLFVVVLSNVTVSLIRWFVTPEIRIPSFVALIATLVTIVELLLNAFFFELYLALGIFIPLIVTNCAILGRAEAFASKHNVMHSMVDGLAVGFGFFLVLFCLGAVRELLATGGLFAQMNLLFGSSIDWHIRLFETSGFLMAALPPGAFIILGGLIALYQWINLRAQKSASISNVIPHESS